MLDKAEIRAAIAKLEFDESSYSNYAKLASLYVIRDKMQEEERGDGGRYVGYYSGVPAPMAAEPATVGEYGDSEFLLAVGMWVTTPAFPPLWPQNRLPWASTGTVSFCLR